MREVGARHVWKLAVSVILAGVLFAWFLRQAPLAEVAQSLVQARLGLVLATVLVALATYAIRALRWGLILRPVGRAGTANLLGCTAAGFATSTVLPARAGEIVRPLLLTARTGMPAAATLASILTERLLDGATVLIVFAGGVLFAHSSLNPGSLMLSATPPSSRRAAWRSPSPWWCFSSAIAPGRWAVWRRWHRRAFAAASSVSSTTCSTGWRCSGARGASPRSRCGASGCGR